MKFVEELPMEIILPLGKVLLPTSNTVSLEGVPCDPGLLGVPAFDEFMESFLENMSPSRLNECLNCDSDNRLDSQQTENIRVIRVLSFFPYFPSVNSFH